MNEFRNSIYLRWLVIIGILRWKLVKYPATFFLILIVYLNGISLGSHIHSNKSWSDAAQRITGIVTGSELKQEPGRESGKSRIAYYCYPIVQYTFGELERKHTLLWLKQYANREAGEDCAREMYGTEVSFWIIQTDTLMRVMEHKPTDENQRNSFITNAIFFPLGIFLLWQMWKRPKKTHLISE